MLPLFLVKKQTNMWRCWQKCHSFGLSCSSSVRCSYDFSSPALISGEGETWWFTSQWISEEFHSNICPAADRNFTESDSDDDRDVTWSQLIGRLGSSSASSGNVCIKNLDSKCNTSLCETGSDSWNATYFYLNVSNMTWQLLFWSSDVCQHLDRCAKKEWNSWQESLRRETEAMNLCGSPSAWTLRP